MKPTWAPKSPASTQLEHFEVAMAECLLAVKSVHNESVSVKELQRAVSRRDIRNLGADVVAASL